MNQANESVGEDRVSTPDIDELVAHLRERVEARRRSGVYPADLEQEMTTHFQRILSMRGDARPLPDFEGAVWAAGQTLPLQAAKIPTASGFPGGQALHKAIAKVVSRQIQGALHQVQGFAQPVHAALEALAQAVSELNRTIHADIVGSIDALYERQAAGERLLAGLTGAADSEPFEEAFDGGPEELLALYRDVAQRLEGQDPVLDVGPGRTDFLEPLRGVDAEPLQVEQDAARRYLAALDDKALGSMTLIEVIERFSALDIGGLVALAADKVRPGGRVVISSSHSRSIHPAYLAFLLREAGFAAVDIEWRGPLPAESVPRLNQLLFAPQKYLIVATR